jgi:hypothetical protein
MHGCRDVRVFDLSNHTIQIKVVHREFISQIWWDDSIHRISTNLRNEMVMDQLILFHKPNKNSEKREDDGLVHSSNQTPQSWSRSNHPAQPH